MTLNRTTVVVLASLALVGGGGAAIAASQAEDRQAFLDDAAKRLGVKPSELETALEEAAVARVDAAVEAGELTKAQGDEIKARIRAGEAPLFRGFGHFGPLNHDRGVCIDIGAMFDAAARYLGVSADDLRTAREEGKSLAQIAREKDKSVDGLEQAMLDAAKLELDKAVEAGSLTSAQRQELLQNLESRIDEMVRATGVGRPGFRDRGSWGPPGESNWTRPAIEMPAV